MVHAPSNQELLDVLKLELHFLEHGGYYPSVKTPRDQKTVFRDSPSCVNLGNPERTTPCILCSLIYFVPPEARNEDAPCHHIPLDDEGTTLATLGAEAGEEQKERLEAWLKNKIAELEAAIENENRSRPE